MERKYTEMTEEEVFAALNGTTTTKTKESETNIPPILNGGESETVLSDLDASTDVISPEQIKIYEGAYQVRSSKLYKNSALCGLSIGALNTMAGLLPNTPITNFVKQLTLFCGVALLIRGGYCLMKHNSYNKAIRHAKDNEQVNDLMENLNHPVR